jgi:hypothetical protein
MVIKNRKLSSVVIVIILLVAMITSRTALVSADESGTVTETRPVDTTIVVSAETTIGGTDIGTSEPVTLTPKTSAKTEVASETSMTPVNTDTVPTSITALSLGAATLATDNPTAGFTETPSSTNTQTPTTTDTPAETFTPTVTNTPMPTSTPATKENIIFSVISGNMDSDGYYTDAPTIRIAYDSYYGTMDEVWLNPSSNPYDKLFYDNLGNYPSNIIGHSTHNGQEYDIYAINIQVDQSGVYDLNVYLSEYSDLSNRYSRESRLYKTSQLIKVRLASDTSTPAPTATDLRLITSSPTIANTPIISTLVSTTTPGATSSISSTTTISGGTMGTNGWYVSGPITIKTVFDSAINSIIYFGQSLYAGPTYTNLLSFVTESGNCSTITSTCTLTLGDPTNYAYSLVLEAYDQVFNLYSVIINNILKVDNQPDNISAGASINSSSTTKIEFVKDGLRYLSYGELDLGGVISRGNDAVSGVNKVEIRITGKYVNTDWESVPNYKIDERFSYPFQIDSSVCPLGEYCTIKVEQRYTDNAGNVDNSSIRYGIYQAAPANTPTSNPTPTAIPTNTATFTATPTLTAVATKIPAAFSAAIGSTNTQTQTPAATETTSPTTTGTPAEIIQSKGGNQNTATLTPTATARPVNYVTPAKINKSVEAKSSKPINYLALFGLIFVIGVSVSADPRPPEVIRLTRAINEQNSDALKEKKK